MKIRKMNNYYCAKHYAQIKQYGKILERTRFDMNEIIILENYAEVIIYNREQEPIAKTLISLDKIDLVQNHKWYLTHAGYAATNNPKLKLHRLIMGLTDRKLQVDHINGNRLDNRNENLRVCTNQQNSFNLHNPKNNKTSGILGVIWDKRANKWKAQIKFNYKCISLGLYDDIQEAIKARREAELKYFGDFAPQHEYGQSINE